MVSNCILATRKNAHFFPDIRIARHEGFLQCPLCKSSFPSVQSASRLADDLSIFSKINLECPSEHMKNCFCVACNSLLCKECAGSWAHRHHNVGDAANFKYYLELRLKKLDEVTKKLPQTSREAGAARADFFGGGGEREWDSTRIGRSWNGIIFSQIFSVRRMQQEGFKTSRRIPSDYRQHRRFTGCTGVLHATAFLVSKMFFWKKIQDWRSKTTSEIRGKVPSFESLTSENNCNNLNSITFQEKWHWRPRR